VVDMLTQEEIDAFITGLALEHGQAVPQAEEGEGTSVRLPCRVRTYDFRRPDKFSKDQMRTLQMLHDNCGRLATTALSTQLRAMTQVAVMSVEQMTYDEFIAQAANPTVLAVFASEPLTGNGMIEIEPGIAFAFIDRIFGGPGNGIDKARPMTDIEHSVIDRLTRAFLGCVRESWRYIVELQPRVEAVEHNPLFAQVASANDIVVTVTFTVTLGERAGSIRLCLPYLMLEPLMSKLSAHHWFSRSQVRARADLHRVLQQRVEDAPVTLVAQLGRAMLTLHELLELKPGDVIKLDRHCGGETEIQVGGDVRFRGSPGLVGKRLAVQITAVVDRKGGVNVGRPQIR